MCGVHQIDPYLSAVLRQAERIVIGWLDVLATW